MGPLSYKNHNERVEFHLNKGGQDHRCYSVNGVARNLQALSTT